MWSIILHGGARDIAPEQEEANRAGVRRAVEAGAGILQQGGSAVDAVVAAVRVLEDNPTFNAGTGSVRRADGRVQMCAGLMEGDGLNVGAVTLVSGLRNPIEAARLVLDEDEILLGGEGADAFAREKGLRQMTDAPLSVPGSGCDTVGCVAMDARGLLAAGTSTGGLDGTRTGRIGDSPMPGCGYYADRSLGACALSGDGEDIARLMLAARLMLRLPNQPPDEAVSTVLAELEVIGGEAGIVLLSPDGAASWNHNSTRFAVAQCSQGAPELKVYLRKSEEGHGKA